MPKPRYCWDANVFIAHLMSEERSQEELDGLREIVDLVDQGRAIIVTSAQVHTEVLNRADGAARDSLERLFATPRFFVQELNSGIGARAARIRESVLSATGVALKGADSAYIATALELECEALHTFDRQLLRISGREEVDGLLITKPYGTQTVLRLDAPAARGD